MELNWTWGGGGEIGIGLRVDLEVKRKFPAHLHSLHSALDSGLGVLA